MQVLQSSLSVRHSGCDIARMLMHACFLGATILIVWPCSQLSQRVTPRLHTPTLSLCWCMLLSRAGQGCCAQGMQFNLTVCSLPVERTCPVKQLSHTVFFDYKKPQRHTPCIRHSVTYHRSDHGTVVVTDGGIGPWVGITDVAGCAHCFTQ